MWRLQLGSPRSKCRYREDAGRGFGGGGGEREKDSVRERETERMNVCEFVNVCVCAYKQIHV